ncbi:MAG: pentapeptide repeat-containing protein [Myxococcota bacterium]
MEETEDADAKMIVGFFGTSNDLTNAQRETLVETLLRLSPAIFVHSASSSADSTAHLLAADLEIPIRLRVTQGMGHRPCTGAFEIRSRLWEFDRDDDIIEDANVLLTALPRQQIRTIDLLSSDEKLAQRMQAARQKSAALILLQPNGDVIEENIQLFSGEGALPFDDAFREETIALVKGGRIREARALSEHRARLLVLDRADLRLLNLAGHSLQSASMKSVNLSGADLTETDLQKVNLSGAILKKANAGKARLYSANLRSSDLGWADFTGADLRSARLQGADLHHTRLAKANLRRVNLEKANLKHADLSEANLEEANLQQARLMTVNLRGSDLRNANLNDAWLIDVNLIQATLQGVNLSQATIRSVWYDDATRWPGDAPPQNALRIGPQANLQARILERADFQGVDLRGADLRKANLVAADFTGASLSRVRFGSANVTSASFRYANLIDADLGAVRHEETDFDRTAYSPDTVWPDTNVEFGVLPPDNAVCVFLGADLSDVDLSGINLVGANLRGVNFTGANLDRTRLLDAICDETTRWPAGFVPEGVRPLAPMSDLVGSDFYMEDLDGALLNGAALTEANLAHASLRGSDLTGASLSRATLTAADLGQARLVGADLTGAQMENALLCGANCSYANFAGANLKGADFSGANLKDAVFDGADLSGARYTVTALTAEGAITTFPRGFDPGAQGMRRCDPLA